MPQTPRAFIVDNLRLAPAPLTPEINLYTAHPASRVSRIAGDSQPYWAYGWAGGAVLARYILDHPEAVKGRRVVDVGSGSGIVAIAAAMAGAIEVIGVDIDANAIAAIDLNAAANGVTVEAMQIDLLDAAPPDTDLILIGDLFYDERTAKRLTAFLDRCLAAGIEALVGDPERTYLPKVRLEKLAEYPTPDFGDVRGSAPKPGMAYRFVNPLPHNS